MSKEEQEEAVRNGMRDYSKPWNELKNSEKRFQCSACPMSFRTITEVKSHELRKHAEVDPREKIQCNHCGKLYLPGPSMLYHELNCKKEDLKMVHECYICLKQCKNKITLARHIKLHSIGDERAFSCSQCSASFKTKLALFRHGVVHSTHRPYVCDKCGSGYKLKKHLDRHKKTSCKYNY